MLEFLRRLLGIPPPVPSALVVPAPPRVVEPRVVAQRLHVSARPVTLQELLRALPDRCLPLASAVELVCRLCDLLEDVHAPLRGVSPADIYFSRAGAMLIGGAPFSKHPTSALRGSLRHLSPEQVMGRASDERSDVFNLASLLHECLTGRPVFMADSDIATLEALRYARLPPRPEEIPPALHDVLVQALREAPEARFQTVKALRAALEPFRAPSTLDEDVEQLSATHVVPSEPPAKTPLDGADEAARLVYADALEEQGELHQASWLRLDSRVRSLSGAALDEALAELRVLSDKVGKAFMSSVARVAVEGCPIRFGFKCPKQWEALQRTERDEVRYCAGCRQEVHFVRTLDELRQAARQDICVAVDPTLVRTEDDLEFAAGVLGRAG